MGWRARPRYDLIVLDAPATGHGLAFLKVPLAASQAVPVGPGRATTRGASSRCCATRSGPRWCWSPSPRRWRSSRRLEFHRLAAEELGHRGRARWS